MPDAGGYPDNYRTSTDPYQSAREPSVDADCAFAAAEKIEALKMQLATAIEAAWELPGISDLYSELRDHSAATDGDAINASVMDADDDMARAA